MKLDYSKFSTDLELFAKQVVEGFITGKHKSPFHGFSVEFAEHRQYNRGESTRHIDWKLYARTKKLFNKKYEEETNLRCQIIIDNSSSMYYPDRSKIDLQNPNKIFFAIYASAVLINLLKKQRDAVGISIASNQLEFHTTSKTTQRHHKILFEELGKLLESNSISRDTDLSTPLHQICEMINKRSLVIVFTDFLHKDKSVEEQFEPYRHMKYKQHEVLLFYLNESKTEANLEFENQYYNFIDMETKEEIKVNPQQLESSYKEMFSNHVNNIKNQCFKNKIEFIEVDINRGFDSVIESYLLKRKKMI